MSRNRRHQDPLDRIGEGAYLEHLDNRESLRRLFGGGLIDRIREARLARRMAANDRIQAERQKESLRRTANSIADYLHRGLQDAPYETAQSDGLETRTYQPDPKNALTSAVLTYAANDLDSPIRARVQVGNAGRVESLEVDGTSVDPVVAYELQETGKPTIARRNDFQAAEAAGMFVGRALPQFTR